MENIKELLEIYQEATPNPESLKFVTNQGLLPNFQVDFKTKESVQGKSALADVLFQQQYVQGVFISQNFVTITKNAEADWFEVTPLVKTVMKDFLNGGYQAVSDDLLRLGAPAATTDGGTPASIEDKIQELLNKYVKPAVEMDGGHIAFKSFDAGVVKLAMQGSCSGCPSSQITLKAGIEGLLKRMIPEVETVEAVEE
jgi:Fe-S cluster biogenesis protein NfuA